MLKEIFDSFFQDVYAEEVEEPKESEEVEEPEEAEEEEEEEPEDTRPAILEECGNTKKCHEAKHHLHECEARVANGSKETCVEEFFHFAHCVDECASPKIFATLK